MVDKPQESARRGDEININYSKLPPKLAVPHRKPSSRQKSLLRGTASSLAKSVHAQQQQQEEEHKKRSCMKKPTTNNNKTHESTPIDKLSCDDNDASKNDSKTPHSQTTPPVLLKKRSFKFPLKNKTMNDGDALTTAGSQQSSSFSDDSPDISADELLNSSRCLSDASIENIFDHYHHHHHYNEEYIPSYMHRQICAACNRNVKVNSESKTSTDSSRRSSLSSLKSDYHLKRNTTKSLSGSSRYSSDSGPDVPMLAHSPSTSPIPTRKKGIIAKQDAVNKNSEKWNEILLQQHQLISLISMEDSYDISKLNHQQEQYETILIETQAKLLQKLTTMIYQTQQQHQKETYYEEKSSKFGRFKWNMSRWIDTIMGDDLVTFEYDPDLLRESQDAWNLDILERPW